MQTKFMITVFVYALLTYRTYRSVSTFISFIRSCISRIQITQLQLIINTPAKNTTTHRRPPQRNVGHRGTVAEDKVRQFRSRRRRHNVVATTDETCNNRR